MKGLTPKLYGSFDAGFGEYIPASSEARTLKVQFRSNKKKNAGGFRCQVLLQRSLQVKQLEQFYQLLNQLEQLEQQQIAAYAQITGSGSGPTTGSGSG